MPNGHTPQRRHTRVNDRPSAASGTTVSQSITVSRSITIRPCTTANRCLAGANRCLAGNRSTWPRSPVTRRRRIAVQPFTLASTGRYATPDHRVMPGRHGTRDRTPSNPDRTAGRRQRQVNHRPGRSANRRPRRAAGDRPCHAVNLHPGRGANHLPCHGANRRLCPGASHRRCHEVNHRRCRVASHHRCRVANRQRCREAGDRRRRLVRWRSVPGRRSPVGRQDHRGCPGANHLPGEQHPYGQSPDASYHPPIPTRRLRWLRHPHGQPRSSRQGTPQGACGSGSSAD